jgi:hypothetical protein
VSHSVFGILHSDSEEFYNDKIKQLEETEQSDLIKLSRQQMVVVKSTLKSVNKTLHDDSRNELILEKGLKEIKEFINKENGEIRENHSYTAMLVALNDHAIQIQRALEEVKDEYNILIQSCLSAKQGIMQPQVLSPIHLIEILKSIQDSFPRDLQVLVPLSEAYLHQLVNIVSIEIYIIDSNLVYEVPLVTHYMFDVYKVIPFPMKVKNTSNKFTFIQPDKEYIMLDTTKQFYVRLHQNDLGLCRMNKSKLVCKQKFPLKISHSTSDCEAQLLQPIRAISESYTQRILELRETLWTPLRDNSWIFVAPVTDHITVVCPNQRPFGIEIKDSGVLTFLTDCTGYGEEIMIRAITMHSVNHTNKDIIPPLQLEVNCCETQFNTINLNELQLESPIKNILTHNNELEAASYKIKEVENLIADQEWKMRHSMKASRMSVLAVIGPVTLGLLVSILCCCCCCKCCRKCWPRFLNWFTDINKCTSIVFKPKIVNSVHASIDSLHRRGMTLNLATNVEGADELGEVTELTPMKVVATSATTKSSSKKLAVGKR